MPKDPSVEFLEGHLENSFKELMEVYLIEDLDWIETDEGARAIGKLAEPTDEGYTDSNLVMLFPNYIEDKD